MGEGGALMNALSELWHFLTTSDNWWGQRGIVVRVWDHIRLSGFCVLAADSDRYVLLLDEGEISPHDAAPLCVRVDTALERNPQYAYARRVRQLAPVRPEFCRRPMDNFVTAALRQGRRLGDLKMPVLHTTGEWRRIFNAVQP